MPVLAHQPPETLTIRTNQPLIFLAGPIQGAPDWQAEAISIIAQEKCSRRSGTNLHIANPRREYVNESFDYYKQVAWEKRGLKRAAKNGAIVFWFAAQDMDLPYEQGRLYAKTTHKEFYRALGWMDQNQYVNVTIGIEQGYNADDQYFDSCLKETKLPIHKTLAEVCLHGLHLVSKE